MKEGSREMSDERQARGLPKRLRRLLPSAIR